MSAPTIERWRMASGRIATIDLSHPAAAVEDARALLREHGGAVPLNEEAPSAAATAAEGENEKSAEDSVKSTLLPVGADALVAAWVTDYMSKRAELLESMSGDAALREWAERFATIRGYSAQIPLLERIEASGMLPSFPGAAMPFWAVAAEINGPIGGEAVVRFMGRDHMAGEFRARLEWGMYVVTKTNHTEPFGSSIPWDSPIVLVHDGADCEFTTPEDAQDLARAITSAASELDKIRRALGDAFITNGGDR